MKSLENAVLAHWLTNVHIAINKRLVVIVLSHKSADDLDEIHLCMDLLITTNICLLRYFANNNHNKYLHTTSCISFSIFIIFFLSILFLVFFNWEISEKIRSHYTLHT